MGTLMVIIGILHTVTHWLYLPVPPANLIFLQALAEKSSGNPQSPVMAPFLLNLGSTQFRHGYVCTPSIH